MTDQLYEIPGHPGYMATEDGRIWSMRRRRFLKPCLAASGYLRVALRDDTFFLHRLISLAFNGLPANPDEETRHLDGNKLNCHASNLKWGTAKQNTEDRERHGTVRRGHEHGNAKLTEQDVIDIRRLAGSGITQRQLATQYQVAQYQIWAIVNRVTWRHVDVN